MSIIKFRRMFNTALRIENKPILKKVAAGWICQSENVTALSGSPVSAWTAWKAQVKKAATLNAMGFEFTTLTAYELKLAYGFQ